jgi:Putative collagen-binding domain of a collagenase/Domain of unknown function (DUF5060)
MLFTNSAVAQTVAQWTRFEASFTSAAEYQNTLQELEVEVEFTSPGGKKHSVAEWFNPATGARSIIGKVENRGNRKFKANSAGDWVLALKVMDNN